MTPPAAWTLRWRPRDRPLAPCAVSAAGGAAQRLAARLAALDDASLGTLEGVAGDGLLVALGPEEQLPWVDGVVYLGRAPDGPALLLPTALDPGLPSPLLERALFRLFPAVAPPLALLRPGAGPASAPGATVASLASARPIDRATLAAWARRSSG